MTGAAAAHPYQYVVLRCVPRADREEFVNVGVVLYCEATGLLRLAHHVDEARLRALDPGIDLDQVASALAFVDAVCRGDATAGAAPVVRPLAREIARAVRGRATSPRWIAGQMRHGHRGAAEIAETVGNLVVFAATTDAVTGEQFDDLFAATLGDKVAYEISGTIAAAVSHAARDAAVDGHGEPVVLLSPACASFDQFANFERRGDAFRAAVMALEGVSPAMERA